MRATLPGGTVVAMVVVALSALDPGSGCTISLIAFWTSWIELPWEVEAVVVVGSVVVLPVVLPVVTEDVEVPPEESPPPVNAILTVESEPVPSCVARGPEKSEVETIPWSSEDAELEVEV